MSRSLWIPGGGGVESTGRDAGTPAAWQIVAGMSNPQSSDRIIAVTPVDGKDRVMQTSDQSVIQTVSLYHDTGPLQERIRFRVAF